MKLPALTKDKFFIDIVVVCGVILVFTLVFLGVYFANSKLNPSKPATQNKTATISANKNQFSLSNTITGKVVAIDVKNRTVTLETFEGKKQQFLVKIPVNVVLSRPSPIKEGDNQNTTSYPPIVDKFEDLRIGSVLSVLSKEDPKLSTNLTALQVDVLV